MYSTPLPFLDSDPHSTPSCLCAFYLATKSRESAGNAKEADQIEISLRQFTNYSEIASFIQEARSINRVSFV